MDVDIEDFRLTDRSVIPCSVPPKRRRQPARFKLKGGFIRGPLPLGWITTAAKLHGKAIQVALALWHLAGLEQSNQVKLTYKSLSAFGISRESMRRSLRALEQTELVTVQRRSGRCPVVTIQDLQSEGDSA